MFISRYVLFTRMELQIGCMFVLNDLQVFLKAVISRIEERKDVLYDEMIEG